MIPNFGPSFHLEGDTTMRLVPVAREGRAIFWVRLRGVPVEAPDELTDAIALRIANNADQVCGPITPFDATWNWTPRDLFAHLIGAHG
jgi:hypothetical protein